MRTTIFIIIFFIFTLIANSKFQSNYYFQNADNSTYLDLPDSLFAFNNIKSSDFIKDIEWDGFTDSTRTKKMVRIDSMTIVKLLCPINVIKADEYLFYMTYYYYISKQPKIGSIQPIIILGTGNDYSELILITLDNKGKPIDHYSLYENSCAGMFEIGDSLVAICPIKNSTLSLTKIKTNIKNVCFRTDKLSQTLTDFARVDSITYETVILPTGYIKTKLVDSTRLYREYKL